MDTRFLDEVYVQRCRTIWWTVYVLDRQISSLMGVPMGIAEDSISTPLPAFPGELERTIALKIQVQLSQILQQIDDSEFSVLCYSYASLQVIAVYGTEGRLNSRYVSATQSVLRNIAKVSQHMNDSFDINGNETMGGISRLSAHLHLLQHQVRHSNQRDLRSSLRYI